MIDRAAAAFARWRDAISQRLVADGVGAVDGRIDQHGADGVAAVAARVERLLVGRGGTIMTPGAGEPFDPAVMEASDVTATANEDEDRTVAEVLAPGLSVPARNVRPARVVVRAFRSA